MVCATVAVLVDGDQTGLEREAWRRGKRDATFVRVPLTTLLSGHRSDTILDRIMIQIESARAPFTSPRIAFQAVTALGRADAMGLLPADEHIATLDLASFRKMVRHIHRAGIARNIQLELDDDLTNSGPGL